MNDAINGALIGGGVVLIGTLITGWFQLRQQRAATAEARAESIRRDRLATYLGLINGTGRVMRWVDLTADRLRLESGDAPSQLTEEEQWPLNARVNVLGSLEVGDRLAHFNRYLGKFIGEAASLVELTQPHNAIALNLEERFAELRELQGDLGASHGLLLQQIRLELGIDSKGDRMPDSTSDRTSE